jgi:hypothetical protein
MKLGWIFDPDRLKRLDIRKWLIFEVPEEVPETEEASRRPPNEPVFLGINLREQKPRRFIVVCMGCVIVAEALSVGITYSWEFKDHPLLLPFQLSLMVSYFSLWLALSRFAKSSVNSAVDGATRSLDERETIIRGKVFEAAYKTLSLVLLIVVLFPGMNFVAGPFFRGFVLIIAVFIPNSLPKVIFAWNEPDLVEISEEEQSRTTTVVKQDRLIY